MDLDGSYSEIRLVLEDEEGSVIYYNPVSGGVVYAYTTVNHEYERLSSGDYSLKLIALDGSEEEIGSDTKTFTVNS